jgi:hypothetical protein
MRVSSSCSAALAVLIALASAACDDFNGDLNGPASSSSRSTFVTSTVVTTEPTSIAPQFLSDPRCPGAPPFVALLNLTIGSGAELSVQRIGFEFRDRFGGRSLPTVFPVPASSSTLLPSSGPIPFPGAAPTPVPGEISFSDFGIGSGRGRTDSFALRFDCGVPAVGTLTVVVESVDRRGENDVSRATVAVGR